MTKTFYNYDQVLVSIYFFMPKHIPKQKMRGRGTPRERGPSGVPVQL